MLSSRLRMWTAALIFPWMIAPAAAQDSRPGQPQSAAPPPRFDGFGDPLPPGALVRLGTSRFRHDGRIFSAAYSADGKRLVTASDDNTIRCWDATTGKLLKQLSAPGFVALSADGSTFFLIDPDDPKTKKNRNIRLYSTVTDQEVGRFEWVGRYSEIGNAHHLYVAFSRDGTTLAVGSYVAKIILVWDMVRGREIRQIKYVGLDSLALAPDGRTLLTGSDHTLWDVATGTKLRTFDAHYDYGGTSAAAFSADGSTLALGGGDASVLLFDVPTGRLRHKLKGEGKVFGGAGGRVTSLAFSTDGKFLGVGSNDWTVRLWDVTAGKQLHQFVGPTFGNVGNHGSVHAVAFTPDGTKLAVASNVPILRQWDTTSGREIATTSSGHRDRILKLAYSRDGKLLATSSTDLTIRIWDTASGAELRQFPGHQGSINGIAFSPDGRQLVSAGGYRDETLQWWDIATGRNLRIQKAGYSNDVAYSPDGRTIATAGDGGIRFWDAATGAALRHFGGRAYQVHFSPNGRRVSDGAHIWDLARGEMSSEFMSVKDVVFSADWKLAAAVGEIGFGSGVYSARLLETITGKEIRTLVKEPSWISSAAFSPDGRILATAEKMGIRLWETATGREIGRLNAKTQSWYYSIAFSPDGRTLASVNSDTSVLIWIIPPIDQEPAAPALTEKDLAGLWETLASEDCPRAFDAITQLIRSHQQSLPYLKDRVKPVTAPSDDQLKQLIADLESDRFDVREKASRELAQWGDVAESVLRSTLEGKPPTETRVRVKALLARNQSWFGDRLRHWRAIQILEGIGTNDAQAILKSLTAGAPISRLTQEAQASLERLKK